MLVGADGVNGVSARALGLGGEPALSGSRSRATSPTRRIDASGYRGRAVLIDFATVPGGYGWVFPKGDHVNFGVGGWSARARRCASTCAASASGTESQLEELGELRGYRLPLRRRRSRSRAAARCSWGMPPVSSTRCPATGCTRGSSAQLRRGRRRSTCSRARAETLEPYDPRLTRQLARLLWASWSVKAALDRFPRTSFALAQTELRLECRRGAPPGRPRRRAPDPWARAAPLKALAAPLRRRPRAAPAAAYRAAASTPATMRPVQSYLLTTLDGGDAGGHGAAPERSLGRARHLDRRRLAGRGRRPRGPEPFPRAPALQGLPLLLRARDRRDLRQRSAASSTPRPPATTRSSTRASWTSISRRPST